MTDKKIIPPDDLVALDDFTSTHPIRVDAVYADAAHPENIFRSGIYRRDARMLSHRELAPIILRAAKICYDASGYVFEIKDCLRTVEAQDLMRNTDIVRAHPEWLEEPGRLLSPPGQGGHPRGMAVDIALIDANGDQVDMGTPFDYLTPDPAVNPAARDYTGFSPVILSNRKILEDAMMQAALEHARELIPLPQEWWDFRFPSSYYGNFAPIHDRDLPRDLRMTNLPD